MALGGPPRPAPCPYCCTLPPMGAHRGQGACPRAPVGQESWRSRLCEWGLQAQDSRPQATGVASRLDSRTPSSGKLGLGRMRGPRGAPGGLSRVALTAGFLGFGEGATQRLDEAESGRIEWPHVPRYVSLPLASFSRCPGSPCAGVRPTQRGCEDFLFLQTGLRAFAFPGRLGCSPSLLPPGVLSTRRDSAEGPLAA